MRRRGRQRGTVHVDEREEVDKGVRNLLMRGKKETER